jgi:ferritin-like metal-binding protein YciE
MFAVTDILISWLKDAHAMEQAAISILEMQSKRLRHYPRVEAKVIEHLEVTREQAKQVKSCLQRHNADTSAMKDLMGRFTGGMNALVTNAAMGDEAVKAGIADYAFENMEIVTYRTLIATANLAGDDETRKICEEILGQEQEMADWLGREMAAITHTFLGRSAIAAQAKR